jgi:hypothetical protein
MSRQHNTLLRAASRIHRSYLNHSAVGDEVAMPVDEWQECQRLTRQLNHARRQQWQHAERLVQNRLARSLPQLTGKVESLLQTLFRPRPVAVPSLRQIHEELLALDAEFAGVKIDLRKTTVTVNTEPITLEGVYLGAFGIELDWQQLGQTGPYVIRSLDPHPAASNSDADHPHVDNFQLCEGEGQAAIRGALAEGRLVDFFMVVRQILSTYNSSSAYVSLDAWFSSSCEECSGSVDEDEGFSCSGCESYICGSCAADCCTCETCVCSSCSSRCHGCQQWHCHDCLNKCAACGQNFCKECQPHEECCECREDEMADESSPDTDAAVHADRVGEAVVPA